MTFVWKHGDARKKKKKETASRRYIILVEAPGESSRWIIYSTDCHLRQKHIFELDESRWYTVTFHIFSNDSPDISYSISLLHRHEENVLIILKICSSSLPDKNLFLKTIQIYPMWGKAEFGIMEVWFSPDSTLRCLVLNAPQVRYPATAI